MRRTATLTTAIVAFLLIPAQAQGRWVQRLDNIKKHIHSNIGLEHGWLICENAPDTSTYLWNRISQGDFCYDYCKEKSNSLKDGWPRSRCRSACWAGYAASNHFYKCWDPEPALREWAKQADKEIKAEYAEFQAVYQQKEAASRESNYFNVLTVDIMKARLEKERAQNKLNYLHDLKSRVDAGIKAYAEPHKEIVGKINFFLNEINVLSKELEGLIKAEATAGDALATKSKTFIEKLFKAILPNPKQSLDDIIASQEHQTFCVDRRSQEVLRDMRSLVSKAWLASESYEIKTRDLANLIALTPDSDATVKKLLDPISQLRDTIRPFEKNVFAEELEAIYAKRVLCEDLTAMKSVVEMRITATSLSERVQEIETSRQQSLLKLRLRNQIGDAKARLDSAILHGELNEILKAKETVSWVANTLKKSLSNTGLSNDPSLKDIIILVTNTAEQMKKDADSALSTENMAALTCKRVKTLDGTIRKTQEEIPSDHPLQENIRKNVAQEFKTLIKKGPFGRLRCPVFSTQKEYLEYDGKVAVIARELESIREETLGGDFQ